jgi:ubiquinone/menaquinone biosynthesis C-methylase UbiE
MEESRSHLEKIRSQFTRQADAYVRLRATKDEKNHTGLAALSGVGPGDRALDVACGPGFLTMALAERGAAAVGIDATEELLSRARAEAERRGLTDIEFRSGDAEHLPFADASFDTATCRAAFHHFLHPEIVLAEMKRVVKPGKTILVADMLTSEDPAKANNHNAIERLCDPSHARALAVSEYEQMFRVAGLELVMSPQTSMDYDADEWLDHGGPVPDVRARIIELLEQSMVDDRTGLNVRREGGKLWFGYRAAAFVLRKA